MSKQPEQVFKIAFTKIVIYQGDCLIRSTAAAAVAEAELSLKTGLPGPLEITESSVKINSVTATDRPELPPEDIREAYRAYVLSRASRPDFDASLLEPFDEWRNEAALSQLVDFADLYLPAGSEFLREQVELHFQQQAQSINRSSYEQVELFYRHHGWATTRSVLAQLIARHAAQPDVDDEEEVGPLGLDEVVVTPDALEEEQEEICED
jgi:hypothetical protein